MLSVARTNFPHQKIKLNKIHIFILYIYKIYRGVARMYSRIEGGGGVLWHVATLPDGAYPSPRGGIFFKNHYFTCGLEKPVTGQFKGHQSSSFIICY
jgi:hypothetical protein